MSDEFSPAVERVLEHKRRLKLLGNLANLTKFKRTAFKQRAATVGLRPHLLLKWWHNLQKYGSCVSDDLADFDEEKLTVAKHMQAKLSLLVDDEIILDGQIAALAESNRWTILEARRIVKNYRESGLWGVSKTHGVLDLPNESMTKIDSSRFRDLGGLTEEELDIVFTRHQFIKPLLDKDKLTNRDVEERANMLSAEGMEISARSLRLYLRNYRKYGRKGLGPLRRSDREEHRNISARVVELVRGIRLSHKDLPVRAVFELAETRAIELGEWPATIYQVRSICKQIPEPIKLVADQRYDEFRNKYQTTAPINFGDAVIYQIDHSKLDVLVRDLRSKRYRNSSGEVRPWLTVVIESRSRRILAHVLGYDQPDRHTVAAAIRTAIIEGGLPHEIWVDNGKDLVANHVRELARGLDIELKALPKHQPQQKGRVERFFGSLNTQLWARTEGYVNSNTKDRNPNVKAKYTIEDIAQMLSEFIAEYHQETHSELGKTPIAYWQDACYTLPTSERDLDVLLMEAESRTVQKKGIEYSNRFYWHEDLGGMVGQGVIVRSPEPYITPSTLAVFARGQWVCTARADQPSRYDIASAKRSQMASIRAEIEKARVNAQPIDDGINSARKPTANKLRPESDAGEVAKPPKSSNTKKPKQDLFKKVLEQYDPDLDEHTAATDELGTN